MLSNELLNHNYVDEVAALMNEGVVDCAPRQPHLSREVHGELLRRALCLNVWTSWGSSVLSAGLPDFGHWVHVLPVMTGFKCVGELTKSILLSIPCFHFCFSCTGGGRGFEHPPQRFNRYAADIRTHASTRPTAVSRTTRRGSKGCSSRS